MLRALKKDELREVRSKYAPGVKGYSHENKKATFARRIRNSIERRHDATPEVLMEMIAEVLRGDTRGVRKRIKKALRGLELSKNVRGNGDESKVREKWISSETYQSLRYELMDIEYEVIQEKKIKGRNSVDLFVRGKRRKYPIEVKISENPAIKTTLNDIHKYQKKIDGVNKIYLFMVSYTGRYTSSKKERIKELKKRVNKNTDAEVVENPPVRSSRL